MEEDFTLHRLFFEKMLMLPLQTLHSFKRESVVCVFCGFFLERGGENILQFLMLA